MRFAVSPVQEKLRSCRLGCLQPREGTRRLLGGSSTAAPEALLHAVRSRFPDVTSLESFPSDFPVAVSCILDQFEQLSQKQAPRSHLCSYSSASRKPLRRTRFRL